MSDCIRGCKRQCHAQECKQQGWHDHPDLLRPADVGHLCARCASNLRGWLDDIPDLYAEVCTISVTEKLSRGESSEAKHTKVSGSPALIRLDIMAITDESSKMGDGIIPTVSAMTSWARMFHEEQHFHGSPPRDLWPAIQLLTVWWSTVLHQPWVDELYLEVHDIHRMLSKATNRPKSVGRCFGVKADCGEKLYPGTDGSITCTKCGRKYSGIALVKLQIQTEQEAKGAA